MLTNHMNGVCSGRGKNDANSHLRQSERNNGQHPEIQTGEIQEYLTRRGWSLVDYVDVGVSGSKEKRPELDRLMADAHKRKFDAVVVWKFDRFARSVSHLLRALETFKALGIEFVSLTEGVDTSTPTGKMIFTVLGAVAELERSLIVERVKAGMRNAKAKGRLPGKQRRELNLEQIKQRMEAGESQRAIAKSLHISPALLTKRLKETQWPRASIPQ